MCASLDTCECTFAKASVCVQIGIVLKVCVSRGFALPVFTGGCTQDVLQARRLRDMCPGSTRVLGSSLHVSLCWGEGAMWRGQLAGAGWGRGCPAAVTFFLFFLLVFSALGRRELPHQEVGGGGDSWFFQGFEAQPSAAPQKGWGLLLEPENCPGRQGLRCLLWASQKPRERLEWARATCCPGPGTNQGLSLHVPLHGSGLLCPRSWHPSWVQPLGLMSCHQPGTSQSPASWQS